MDENYLPLPHPAESLWLPQFRVSGVSFIYGEQGDRKQGDIIYVSQNSLLGVCFAHFLAHLFRNQPQSNFIKLLLTLKETLIYWWGGREKQYKGEGRGGTNYLMSDGSRMYCTIGGT